MRRFQEAKDLFDRPKVWAGEHVIHEKADVLAWLKQKLTVAVAKRRPAGIKLGFFNELSCTR
jgi:hypothetical protein